MQNQHILESLAMEYIFPKTSPDYALSVTLNESFDFVRKNIMEESTHSSRLSLERTFVDLPPFDDELENCQEEKKVTECTSSWGDFEGFGESMAKSESFNCTLEALRNNSKSKNFQGDIPHDELHCSTSCNTCDLSQILELNATTAGSSPADSPIEDRKDYANIFKLSFPAIPFQETQENVKGFEQLLKANEEDNEIAKVIKTQLGMNFSNVWRMVHDARISTGLEYSCRESRKSLLLALAVDSSEKDATAELDRITESSNIIEDLVPPPKMDGFKADASKALIQTKLLVPPDSKHGQGFSYQLYLKRAPSNANVPAQTFSGKKSIFSINNLIMKS
ncbi:hypothetical protein NDU88_005375 [Pleurodeles waltl]|uniref:Aftiphilin clathrin-binding box domain-containing protein n=1 Tax=Pleurodeles waltl TaxID=8319 RepID=A0AAV7N5M6_PLEWA|nr:hypothetical protein NDU88_005375 [Pleurodeles waltl]